MRVSQLSQQSVKVGGAGGLATSRAAATEGARRCGVCRDIGEQGGRGDGMQGRGRCATGGAQRGMNRMLSHRHPHMHARIQPTLAQASCCCLRIGCAQSVHPACAPTCGQVVHNVCHIDRPRAGAGGRRPRRGEHP